MYICSSCGKTVITDRMYPNGMCQGCYNYFIKGGIIYPLPELGEIIRDEKGRVICHICGRSYIRLGSHIRESHGMTIDEYKEKFGLCACARTTEDSYSAAMSDYAYKYDMPEQLKRVGANTRIKPGEKDKRFGKKIRLQEINQMRERCKFGK